VTLPDPDWLPPYDPTAVSRSAGHLLSAARDAPPRDRAAILDGLGQAGHRR
jgi:hypothetical protein